ncbi:MAG: SurA N-terminal domain-containing protein [Sandaracinus sp.]|nr:SurA N-terminal domain-containing protein [Sandaracinus sp.]
MKRALLVIAILGATLARDGARADVVERVVATVDDEAIFLSDLRKRAMPFLPRLMEVPELQRLAALRQLYDELLDQLINEELVERAAQRQQIRVSSADVDRAVMNVVRQNGLEESEFWEVVAQQGYSQAEYRSDLRRQLLRYRLLNERVRGRVNITEEDVRRVYDQRTRRANRALRFRTSHVLVPVAEDATATEVAEARDHADEIHAEITAETFEDFVDEVGGGDLGWLRQGDLPEALEEVLLALQPGEISDPVRGPSGFHVFLLHERERGDASVPPFEQMRDQIYQEMMGRAMERQERLFLEELRRGAIVEKLL